MINIDAKITNKSSVLRMLETSEGKELLAAFQDIGIELNRRLRKEDKLEDLYRLQGRLEVVSAILDLRSEIKATLERIKPNVILEQKRPTAGTA